MRVEYIAVVSGLMDVASFLAASARHGAGVAPDRIVLALFGREVSLPEALQTEFSEIVARAFPQAELVIVPPHRVELKTFVSEGYDVPALARNADRRVVFSAALQSRFTRSFLSWLSPDELVFFDNGLSSYADWHANTLDHVISAGVPRPSAAYLSLHPTLDVPAYLRDVPVEVLRKKDFAHAFKRLRAGGTERPPGTWLPGQVIVGTSLFRTGRISWEAERALYLRLITRLKRSGETDILFKAHPRALTQPLITPEDGVAVFASTVPLEAYVRPNSVGTVYSISSSALITMPQFYGWQARRLSDPDTRKLFEQQRAIKGLECAGAMTWMKDVWLGPATMKGIRPIGRSERAQTDIWHQ
ncbi:MAG: alpha-2,8-polysialyltransferase family protein [Hyphomonadaceae bacterium]|nr:alpha-2,8-polysialyltransferase family protein [Hyphomonadaceae bacterium]